MEYCYRDIMSTCNKTRIYPSGCCPFEHSCTKHNKCTCSCKCCDKHDDGVNRINFCPPSANTCHCHPPKPPKPPKPCPCTGEPGTDSDD